MRTFHPIEKGNVYRIIGKPSLGTKTKIINDLAFSISLQVFFLRLCKYK